MKHHSLKIKPKYLDDLMSGKKTFEVRLNDRDYQVGDRLGFDTKKYKAWFEVIYIHSGLGLRKNYVCMSVKLVKYLDKLKESK